LNKEYPLSFGTYLKQQLAAVLLLHIQKAFKDTDYSLLKNKKVCRE